MKNILLILACSLFFYSCEDFLNLKPQGMENSDNYMNTEDNAIRVVNGMYDLLNFIPESLQNRLFPH